MRSIALVSQSDTTAALAEIIKNNAVGEAAEVLWAAQCRHVLAGYPDNYIVAVDMKE